LKASQASQKREVEGNSRFFVQCLQRPTGAVKSNAINFTGIFLLDHCKYLHQENVQLCLSNFETTAKHVSVASSIPLQRYINKAVQLLRLIDNGLLKVKRMQQSAQMPAQNSMQELMQAPIDVNPSVLLSAQISLRHQLSAPSITCHHHLHLLHYSCFACKLAPLYQALI